MIVRGLEEKCTLIFGKVAGQGAFSNSSPKIVTSDFEPKYRPTWTCRCDLHLDENPLQKHLNVLDIYKY